MKTLFTTLLAFAVLAFTAQADLTIKVSDVHLCCPKCITAAKKVGASVPGVSGDGRGEPVAGVSLFPPTGFAFSAFPPCVNMS